MPSTFASVLPDAPTVRIFRVHCNVMLAVCLVCSPFLFYVIWTQSKSMGFYKWILLNHAFWSMTVQLFVNVTKPVILTPHASGYHCGFFAFGDFRLSTSLLMAGLSCVLGVVAALVIAICNRYLAVFPGCLRQFVRSKLFYCCIGLVYFIFQVMLVVALIPTLMVTKSEVLAMAMAADENLRLFFDLNSFFFVNREIINVGLLLAFIALVIMIAGGFVIAIILGLQMRCHAAQFVATSRLQRDLILCSVAQVLNATIFMGIPLVFMVSCICFRISDSAETMTWLVMLFGTAGSADTLTTFIFIVPYRRFVIKLWRSHLSCCRKNVGTTSRATPQHSLPLPLANLVNPKSRQV